MQNLKWFKLEFIQLRIQLVSLQYKWQNSLLATPTFTFTCLWHPFNIHTLISFIFLIGSGRSHSTASHLPIHLYISTTTTTCAEEGNKILITAIRAEISPKFYFSPASLSSRPISLLSSQPDSFISLLNDLSSHKIIILWGWAMMRRLTVYGDLRMHTYMQPTVLDSNRCVKWIVRFGRSGSTIIIKLRTSEWEQLLICMAFYYPVWTRHTIFILLVANKIIKLRGMGRL